MYSNRTRGVQILFSHCWTDQIPHFAPLADTLSQYFTGVSLRLKWRPNSKMGVNWELLNTVCSVSSFTARPLWCFWCLSLVLTHFSSPDNRSTPSVRVQPHSTTFFYIKYLIGSRSAPLATSDGYQLSLDACKHLSLSSWPDVSQAVDTRFLQDGDDKDLFVLFGLSDTHGSGSRTWKQLLSLTESSFLYQGKVIWSIYTNPGEDDTGVQTGDFFENGILQMGFLPFRR